MNALARRSMFVVLALALCASAAAQPRYRFEATHTVLPKSIVPVRYELALQLDPEQDVFGGRVKIDLLVREPSAAVVLHAKGLQVHRATLHDRRGGRDLLVQTDEATQTLRLTPRDGRRIEAGAQRLTIAYQGRVDGTGIGLYRDRYTSNGRPQVMLATFLEAVNARRVYPGFDEPVFRAAFDVEITAPRGYTVLSNQPLLRRTEAGASVRHRFKATPPMPSYLFALAVGRFDSLQGQAAGVPLRIFTAPGKRELARYAIDVTQRVLPYYNAYFGVPYALPKLDQLAVPGTRDGAMEDWGLISYAEDWLLYDPQRSSPAVQRRVFDTVAHEIAHQWFGNLVSVAAWDEIWLNEAFATWMATKAAERFHPEWQLRLALRAGLLDRAMERDATAATRALRSGPVNESHVFEVFSRLTYDKGGAVLSMLEQWVGEEAFQRGLAAYMKERRLAPATAGDLWHHFGEAAGRPVGAVAASWTDQAGFPVVEASAACEVGRTLLTLRQQRFAMTGEPAAAPDVSLWQVPVRWQQGSVVRTELLDTPQRRFEWPGCSDAPLVVNAGGRGFYRVRYDDGLQRRLSAGFASLDAADRASLLSDSFALVKAGQQTLARHFDWLAQMPLVDGAGRSPLFALAVSQLQELDGTLAGSPAHEALRRAARSLLAPELDRLGWQLAAGEDAEATRLRGQLIEALAQFDDPTTVAAVRERFSAALGTAGSVSLPGALRSAMIRAAGHHADAAQFESLWSALHASESAEDRGLYIDALAKTSDPQRAQRVLGLALSDKLPPNQATWVPAWVARKPGHTSMAYAFMVEHWPAISARASDGASGDRASLLPSTAQTFSDPAAAARLRADQQRLAGPVGTMPAEVTAVRIELRAALREREGQRLADALTAWRAAR